jgi:hypothetical protein
MPRRPTAQDFAAQIGCAPVSDSPAEWDPHARNDEHVMNFVSMWGWHRMVGVIARSVESGEFDKLLERIPLHEQREK